MKSFVKALWSRTRKEPGARTLSHPRELAAGDMIKLSDSFGLPAQLRDQTFKVVGIGTYHFEYAFETSFSLESLDDTEVSLIVEKEDGRERAAFSVTIDRDVVGGLFDLDEFATVFEDDEQTVLHLREEPEAFARLVAPEYRQEAAGERGYYYEKDYRGSRPPDEEGEGEPFDYYCLVSDDGDFAVEVEVWQGGETDVSLTIYRPLSDIKELWPGG